MMPSSGGRDGRCLTSRAPGRSDLWWHSSVKLSLPALPARQGWWHDLFIGDYDYTFLCTPVWPYPWMCGKKV